MRLLLLRGGKCLIRAHCLQLSKYITCDAESGDISTQPGGCQSCFLSISHAEHFSELSASVFVKGEGGRN